MTASLTLHGIAADVVGHYGNAAKSLVTAYRAGSARALAAGGSRYAELVDRIPAQLVGGEAKARIVAAERRMAAALGEGVKRSAQGYDRAIELVSGQAAKGIEAFAQRTDWAKDMFVVGAVRRFNLPAAKLSLELATRIDDAAQALSARADGSARPATKATAKKRTARRVRRAA